MSDITINICFSNDTVAQKRKRKNKNFRRRQRQKKTESKHAHVETVHNGTSAKHSPLVAPTQNKSLLPTETTVSVSHCSSKPSASTCTLPSWGFTVNSQVIHETPSTASASHFNSVQYSFNVNTKDSQEKPNKAVDLKPATSNADPSSSSSYKAAPTKYLAIDCEMVGAGPKGSISQLARCSIVSYEGDVVYDKFIIPPMPITDYRTRWSGIRRSDLVRATPYAQARKEILRLLMGKVVVGHAIHNDFKVLSYSHPAALTRDTSRIPLLNIKAGYAENACASLKRLTKAILNCDIQTGKKGHSSVEDARATMELYKVVEEEWERTLASKTQFTQ